MPRKRTHKTLEKAKELLHDLQHTYPHLFPKNLHRLKPWHNGLHNQLRQDFTNRYLIPAGRLPFSAAVWHTALHAWFHDDLKRRIAYLETLNAGAMRMDLNGKPTEPVSDEHAQQAKTERDALKAIYLAQLKRRLARRQKGRPG